MAARDRIANPVWSLAENSFEMRGRLRQLFRGGPAKQEVIPVRRLPANRIPVGEPVFRGFGLERTARQAK